MTDVKSFDNNPKPKFRKQQKNSPIVIDCVFMFELIQGKDHL